MDVIQSLINEMMNNAKLILYSRGGCCICEKLEERLKNISLNSLLPSLDLYVIDIDSDKVSNSERLRYDLEVPVMVVDFKEINTRFTLPRVSPRLKEEQLSLWLQKTINKLIEPN